jgi:hypothetical protein
MMPDVGSRQKLDRAGLTLGCPKSEVAYDLLDNHVSPTLSTKCSLPASILYLYVCDISLDITIRYGPRSPRIGAVMIKNLNSWKFVVFPKILKVTGMVCPHYVGGFA